MARGTIRLSSGICHQRNGVICNWCIVRCISGFWSPKLRDRPAYDRISCMTDEEILAQVDPATLAAWHREFDAAARRPLTQRLKYAFIKTYKPVLDDASYRSFESM